MLGACHGHKTKVALARMTTAAAEPTRTRVAYVAAVSVSLPSPGVRPSLPRPSLARPALARPAADAWRDIPRRIVVVAIVAAAVAWVPMFLLAAVESVAKGRWEAMRLFATDFASHARYVIAIPLVLLSDALMTAAFSRCEEHLEASGLVAGSPERLRAGIELSRWLRGSRVPTVVLTVVVLAIAVFSTGLASRAYLEGGPGATSWFSTWQRFVAFPMFRLFWMRWLFRWLVWAGFLAWVRGLDLRLLATHPDRCGGLGFVTVPVSASLGAVFGMTLTAAMGWRYALASHAATVAQIQGQVLFFGVVWLVITLGPLIVFAPRLLRLKRIAVVEYSRLGDEYTRAFHDKWLGERRTEEPLLGTPDIQSLADLGGAMEIVHGLRPTPIDLHLASNVAITYAVALLPVVLSQLSVDQLLMKLVSVVF